VFAVLRTSELCCVAHIERANLMKKLACMLGRHDWTTHVEDGESYKVCAACGKSPREQGRRGLCTTVLSIRAPTPVTLLPATVGPDLGLGLASVPVG
jgi:hypothetical protein